MSDSNTPQNTHTTSNGYTPIKKMDIKDLISDIENTGDDSVPSLSGFGNFIEQMMPGGMDSMQKMMDNFVDIANKKQEAQQRLDEIVNDSDQQIDGNSTVNDIGGFLQNMQNTLAEDEQFQNTMKEMQENLSKAFEDSKNNKN